MKSPPRIPRGAHTELLAVHEDLPSDFFELLEPHAERLEEDAVLSERQVNLPFGPESEQTRSCMRPHICEANSNCGYCLLSFHVGSLLPANSGKGTPTEGGGPVKRFLTTGQKCLFATSWFTRGARLRESS